MTDSAAHRPSSAGRWRPVVAVVASVVLSPVSTWVVAHVWSSGTAIAAAVLIYFSVPMLSWAALTRPRTAVASLLALYAAWALNLLLGVGLLYLALAGYESS